MKVGWTQGGFPSECSPGAAPPGWLPRSCHSPEALLRGYIPGIFPPGPPRRIRLALISTVLPLARVVVPGENGATGPRRAQGASLHLAVLYDFLAKLPPISPIGYLA